MNEQQTLSLANLILAPYIQRAIALTRYARTIGGNMFRHAMSTLAVLIDYHYFDPVLLKASVIHDLIEEIPETDMESIKKIDKDGEAVLKLVLEVTRNAGETKDDFLRRILESGSQVAKVLKVADRISNLIDINLTLQDKKFVSKYLKETEDYILPMARQVNEFMVIEVRDLIMMRREKLD
jgi:GTP pyrophosphokinase